MLPAEKLFANILNNVWENMDGTKTMCQRMQECCNFVYSMQTSLNAQFPHFEYCMSSTLAESITFWNFPSDNTPTLKEKSIPDLLNTYSSMLCQAAQS